MVSHRPNIEGFQALTGRETQLILLSGEGLTDKEIAATLGISVGTVITLWSKVRAKLGINSRVSAVSVMSAVVSRLSSQFSAFGPGQVDFEGMLGRPSGIRVLVNRKLIVLSCSLRASMILGVRTGLPINDPFDGTAYFDQDERPFGDLDMPWIGALAHDRSIFDLALTVRRDDRSEELLMDCHTFDDPILNRVAILDFRFRADEADKVVRLDRGLAAMSTAGTLRIG